MNYLKYAGLFVAILFGIFVGIFVGIYTIALIAVVVFTSTVGKVFAHTTINIAFTITAIALTITAVIISKKIIKSNGRVMTFSEIVKYALSFSIVSAMVWVITGLLLGVLLPDGPSLPFDRYILEFSKAIVVILIPTLITMFLVNIYFKYRYKDGLKSTQVQEQKKQELEKFKRQRLTSIILFVIFVYGCVRYILGTVKIGSVVPTWFALYTIPYFIYLVISLIIVYFRYKKILFLNIIAILATGLVIGSNVWLNMNGFCYKTKTFTSDKAAMIDEAVAGFIYYRCKYEKYYFRKEMGLEEKECSVSFKSIKEELPHCFTENRPDKCVGEITYLNFKSGDTVKEKMLIYAVGRPQCVNYWRSCNFFDYVLYGRGYSIRSGLSNDYSISSTGRIDVYIFNSCGKYIHYS
jgi:MFS family permease